MRVMAFDPGGTTGWAVHEPMGKVCGQVQGLIAVWSQLAKVVPTTVVVEKFKLTPHRRAVDLAAVEVIGVIKHWCELTVTELVWQDRAQKEFFTRERLTAKGLWVPGKPHAMDAMRHLLVYLKEFT